MVVVEKVSLAARESRALAASPEGAKLARGPEKLAAPSRIVYLIDNRLKAMQPWPIVTIDPRRDALVFVAKLRGAIILGHASLAQAVAHSVAGRIGSSSLMSGVNRCRLS